MSYVYLSLGSNLGNRKQYIQKAIKALGKTIGELTKCSSFYETVPDGFPSENNFLNVAAVFETSLQPAEILQHTEQIEKQLGRTEKSHDRQYADRCIDIDILMYDDQVINTPRLTIPHPMMHKRTFVLEPLNEIAPDILHPILKENIETLLQEQLEHTMLKEKNPDRK